MCEGGNSNKIIGSQIYEGGFGIESEIKKLHRKRSPINDQKIYIVTGTPGVGKTLISNLLASKLGAEVISVGDLVKKENLHIGWDDERKTLVADLEMVSKRIRELIDLKRKTLIIEGHYAVQVVPPEKVNLVFVLRRDPRELKKILEDRGYNQEKLKENLAAEILDVCLFDAVNICGLEKICEIDTTEKKPDEILDEITMIIKGEKKRQVGIVDWLGMLEAEGELDEYMKEF